MLESRSSMSEKIPTMLENNNHAVRCVPSLCFRPNYFSLFVLQLSISTVHFKSKQIILNFYSFWLKLPSFSLCSANRLCMIPDFLFQYAS